jgi:hypothetical protein
MSATSSPKDCIVIKGKQFTHLFVYDGIDDQVHCIFCQLSFLTKRAADDTMLWWRQNQETRWPEGSEI